METKRRRGAGRGASSCETGSDLASFSRLAHATGFIRTNTNGGTKRGVTKFTAVKSDAGSIIIETINDQGKRSDNSLVRAPKTASERSEPQNPLHSGEFCDSAPADPTPTTLSWRAVLTRIQRAHAASTRQQSANLPLLQNPTGLFEENLRVFNCRPLSATAGDQRFLLLDHSVDLLPRHSCEPFSWRLVVRRNVVGSVNVDIDACRFLHDTPPFQSALSSSPRTTRFSHSLYPHRRAWIVVHSEQEAPARSCGKPVAVVRA